MTQIVEVRQKVIYRPETSTRLLKCVNDDVHEIEPATIDSVVVIVDPVTTRIPDQCISLFSLRS